MVRAKRLTYFFSAFMVLFYTVLGFGTFASDDMFGHLYVLLSQGSILVGLLVYQKWQRAGVGIMTLSATLHTAFLYMLLHQTGLPFYVPLFGALSYTLPYFGVAWMLNRLIVDEPPLEDDASLDTRLLDNPAESVTLAAQNNENPIQGRLSFGV